MSFEYLNADKERPLQLAVSQKKQQQTNKLGTNISISHFA